MPDAMRSDFGKIPMITRFRPYYLIFAAFLQILHFFTNAAAQAVDVLIEIRPENPQVARVTGRLANAEKVRDLSFVRSIAGIQGLGERISDLKLIDARNIVINYKSPVPGEYVSDSAFASWSYSVDLSARKEAAAAAHVSWISGGRGMLMFNDILPLFGAGQPVTGKVQITLPKGWRVSENLGDIITSDDLHNEVAAIGTDLRTLSVNTEETAISLNIDDSWLFTGEEAVEFVRAIHTKTSEIFGGPAAKAININILRFPQNMANGQWQAETRGRSVTIISSDMPFRTQSLQRLHEQLRHEIFHLWIPNRVNLSGKYDWFYEGFALYSSLKLAVAENRIRFEDFLDTLSRAYAIDTRQTQRLSLIHASNSRWAGNETYLYARGMFVAFLCDLAVLSTSKTKRSINDLVREVYTKHKFPAPRGEGTDAILKLMRSRLELLPVVEKYVESAGKFELLNELATAGLELSNGLRVTSKLNRKQKDILDALGYNNWRRLSLGPIK
jgi:hypothetical protein